MPLQPRPLVASLSIFTDACSWGIAIYIAGIAFQGALSPQFFRLRPNNIGTAEWLAVEVATHLLVEQGLVEAVVTTRVDNHGLIGAWIKRRSSKLPLTFLS